MGWWYRRGGGRSGPWPGAGPFSHLPPWQRPGWLYGRWMQYPWWVGYSGAPTQPAYNLPPQVPLYPWREPYYPRRQPQYLEEGTPQYQYMRWAGPASYPRRLARGI
ncbi:MAG: hypothetical protein QW238_01640 [Candidatus Bathyarchaeia archaeon]